MNRILIVPLIALAFGLCSSQYTIYNKDKTIALLLRENANLHMSLDATHSTDGTGMIINGVRSCVELSPDGKTLVSAPYVCRSEGDATTTGDNSPAVTGGNNHIVIDGKERQ